MPRPEFTVSEIVTAEADGRDLAPLIAMLESSKPISRLMRTELAALLRQRRLEGIVIGRPADRTPPRMQVNLHRAKAYFDMLRADLNWQIATGKPQLDRDQADRLLDKHIDVVADEFGVTVERLRQYLDGELSGSDKAWRRKLKAKSSP